VEAFGLLTEYMQDPATRDAAEIAAANLLWETRNQPSDESRRIAGKLLQSGNKAARNKAGAVISDWSKYKSYVTSWLVAGPYKENGKNGEAVFKQVFPAETGNRDVKWTRLTSGINTEDINLEAQLGGHDNCCAYVKASLDSPAEQSARLELGSDDGIKAWLNGKLVHENMANRGCTPGEDSVKVTLDKGRNVLLLKIVDNTGHWAFSCRLRGDNGMPIEGLKASAE
jgi:hypothetical protein